MQLFARSIRTFRYLVASRGWFTLLLAVSLLMLEVSGRSLTNNDWHDALTAALLAVMLVAVAHQHHRAPLVWMLPITAGLRAVGSWLKTWLVEVGYDLRGTPPVRRGVPPIVLAIASVFIGWGVVLALAGDYFPNALRAFGVNVFYIGYLLLMLGIWGSLLLGIVIAAYFTVGLIHDELTADGVYSPRAPSRAALFLALGGSLLLASRFVPLWYVLGGSLIAWCCLIGLGLFAASGDVRFLWRPRGTTRVRSLSASQSAAIIFGLATAFALNLSVTAAGSAVWTAPPLPNRTAMPLTIALGSALGWFLLALVWVFVWQAAKERFRSPARSARRILHVRGSLSAADRRAMRRVFPRRAWRIDSDPRAVHSCAVTVELVEPARSQAREFDPAWPLKLSLADLNDPQVIDRIARRSDIQSRRRLISGLERLFKVAKQRKYRSGHGYWVAPHLQLWNGLRRDEPEPEPTGESPMVHDNIGPAYHRVFAHLTRHLFHVMMRSLHLDLIFVEDGVTFRRFARVVRRVFELYDKQPDRPADDLHFVGLTGTKAMVYEFQFDNPYESDTYPEPKFTALGRARILLVFRDRQEDEELVEPPFDFSRTPVSNRS